MNFGTLKSRLLAQIGRAPSDLCYELVTAEINEGVRIAAMQTEITFDAAETYTLPTDYLEAVSVHLTVGGSRYSLEAVEPATLDDVFYSGNTPTMFSVSNGVMRFNGASGGGTVSLRYYQKQADLASDSDENAVLTAHPAIYVYGVLAHHAALIRDTEALSVQFPAYERAVQKARVADNSKRVGGILSGPRVRSAP